jgi:hypothetical protein
MIKWIRTSILIESQCRLIAVQYWVTESQRWMIWNECWVYVSWHQLIQSWAHLKLKLKYFHNEWRTDFFVVALTSFWSWKIAEKLSWSHNLHYNMLILCVLMCLTGYRLGPWTSYKHETGIIRTSRTWGCVTWKNFSWKVTSGQITE